MAFIGDYMLPTCVLRDALLPYMDKPTIQQLYMAGNSKSDKDTINMFIEDVYKLDVMDLKGHVCQGFGCITLTSKKYCNQCIMNNLDNLSKYELHKLVSVIENNIDSQVIYNFIENKFANYDETCLGENCNKPKKIDNYCSTGFCDTCLQECEDCGKLIYNGEFISACNSRDPFGCCKKYVCKDECRFSYCNLCNDKCYVPEMYYNNQYEKHEFLICKNCYLTEPIDQNSFLECFSYNDTCMF